MPVEDEGYRIVVASDVKSGLATDKDGASGPGGICISGGVDATTCTIYRFRAGRLWSL